MCFYTFPTNASNTKTGHIKAYFTFYRDHFYLFSTKNPYTGQITAYLIYFRYNFQVHVFHKFSNALEYLHFSKKRCINIIYEHCCFN